MNKNIYSVIIIFSIVGIFLISGCAKKEAADSDFTPPEDVSTITSSVSGQDAMQEGVAQQVNTQAEGVSISQDAQIPQETTSAIEQQASIDTQFPLPTPIIQEALKNCGLYSGEIDGKLGPMTKKAIEDFQRNNGLEIDGRVGPKTWQKLSAYINSPMAQPQAGLGE